MLDENNEIKFSMKRIRLTIMEILCLKLKKHPKTNMHSHNLSAHL